MPEETANIRLDFPELDEKIASLRDLIAVLRELQGLGGSGGGGGVPGVGVNPQTIPGTAIAPVPQQSLPAVATAAGAAAGTSGVAQQVSASVGQSAPNAPSTPATSNNPSQQDTGGKDKSLYDMLGGATIVGGIARSAQVGFDYYGQRSTNVGYVSPYQAQQNMIVPTATAAGAAIGSLIPGVGTVIGAGIGYAAGSIAQAAWKPYADLADAQAHYAAIGVGPMLDKTDLINAVIPLNLQGKMIAPRYLQELSGESDQMFLSERLGAFANLRYSRASVRAFGADAMRDGGSFEGMAEKLMGANVYANPEAVMGAAMAFGNMRMYRRAAAVMEQQANLDLGLAESRADVGYESLRLSFASKYGSPDDVNAQAGVVAGFYKQQGARARARAAVSTGEEQVALMNEARTADLQARMQQESYFSSLGQYNQSAGAYGMGQANRAFERALFSGAPVEGMPYAQRIGAVQSQIGRLNQEMREREQAGMLSPAMRMQYLEQIGQLQQQADVLIPREREQAGIRQSAAGLELANTRQVGAVSIETARGSGSDQARVLEARVAALQKEKELTDQILANSRYLTNEEKLQLATRSESLKVQTELAQVAVEVARSKAREAAFGTSQAETRSSAMVGVLEAGTSGDITSFSIKGFRAAEQEVGFYQSEIKRMEQFDPDNPLIQEYRQKLAQAKVGAGVARQGLADVPVSPQLAERQAQLRASMAISQMGMGTFGDVRQNLREQVGLAAQRVRDIDAREKELRSQGITITPAMRAQFAQEKAQAQVDMAGLMMQYEEGWDQRLVSQVYNMPGNAVLAMSQMTHREAARSGVFHRAFGGSRAQTEEMRSLFPRMMGMLGSGDPGALSDRAAAAPVNINLRVKLEDDKGTLLETGMQVTKTKTGTDVNVNESSRRRPSG